MRQLLLLMDKNGRLLLSDVSLYDNIGGKFIPRDPSLKEIVKEINESEEIDSCVAFDPYIYNAIFSNFTVISSQKFKNEQLILHGVDKTGTAVFLSLLLNRGEFKSFE